MSDTTTATADQAGAINALVIGTRNIAETETTISVKSFDDRCDLYKGVSDTFWTAIKAIGADDADKAGSKSLDRLNVLSKGKFKVDSEVKGVKVKGTVSKSTVSRLRTMQHDSVTRRNVFKARQIKAGKAVEFGTYVTFLGNLANKRVDANGQLTDAERKAKAKRDAISAKRAKTTVTTLDVSTFVKGATKLEKLIDLYSLAHDLQASIDAAERGVADSVKTAARTKVAAIVKAKAS